MSIPTGPLVRLIIFLTVAHVIKLPMGLGVRSVRHQKAKVLTPPPPPKHSQKGWSDVQSILRKTRDGINFDDIILAQNH